MKGDAPAGAARQPVALLWRLGQPYALCLLTFTNGEYICHDRPGNEAAPNGTGASHNEHPDHPRSSCRQRRARHHVRHLIGSQRHQSQHGKARDRIRLKRPYRQPPGQHGQLGPWLLKRRATTRPIERAANPNRYRCKERPIEHGRIMPRPAVLSKPLGMPAIVAVPCNNRLKVDQVIDRQDQAVFRRSCKARLAPVALGRFRQQR